MVTISRASNRRHTASSPASGRSSRAPSVMWACRLMGSPRTGPRLTSVGAAVGDALCAGGDWRMRNLPQWGAVAFRHPHEPCPTVTSPIGAARSRWADRCVPARRQGGDHRLDKNGGNFWVHYLPGGAASVRPASGLLPVVKPVRAGDATLDHVYRALLGNFPSHPIIAVISRHAASPMEKSFSAPIGRGHGRAEPRWPEGSSSALALMCVARCLGCISEGRMAVAAAGWRAMGVDR